MAWSSRDGSGAGRPKHGGAGDTFTVTGSPTMKNSLLASALAAELADNTSAATAVVAGFAIETQNYSRSDEECWVSRPEVVRRRA
jgi:hypothetical protein